MLGLAIEWLTIQNNFPADKSKRLQLRRAVVTDPVILVADEPTGDLDRKSAEEILTLMERLNQEFKKTVVVVTHDQHHAEKARRLLHLDKGDLI